MKKKRQLKVLDKTLRYIYDKTYSKVTEGELFREAFIENCNVEYLLEKKFITRSKTPVIYQLSKEGKIFINKGGFINEYWKSEFDWLIKSTHLIISIVVLLVSLTYTQCSNKQNSNSIESIEKNILMLNSKLDSIKTNQRLHKDSVGKLINRYDELYLKISQPSTKNTVNLIDSTKI